MAGSGFSNLLKDVEQLSVEIDEVGDLPKVERTPRQILEASQDLWTRVTATGTQEIQANLLLGSKGVDLPQLTQKLEALSSKETFEPIETDSHKDLNTRFEKHVATCLDKFYKKTHKHTTNTWLKNFSDKLSMKSRLNMHSLMEAMSSKNDEKFVKMPIHMTKIPPHLKYSDSTNKSPLEPIEKQYVAILMEYNHAVVTKGVPPCLIDRFSQISSDQKVQESWNLVKHMTQIPSREGVDPLYVRVMPKVKLKLISLARKYLENRYLEYMGKVVGGNSKRQLDTATLIRRFVAIMSPGTGNLDAEQIDGCPLWAFIYYCIRCGNTKEAIEIGHKAGPPFSKITQALEEFDASNIRLVSSSMEKLLETQYDACGKDPYKRAIFCILGKLDLAYEHSDIMKSADDYLWLKLSLLQENAKDSSGPKLSRLSNLQTMIVKKQGEHYYKNCQDPYVYFEMLCLTGLFEAAIDYLIRRKETYVQGLHMAIALYEKDILAVPYNYEGPIIVADPTDPEYLYRYNVNLVVRQYGMRIVQLHLLEGMHYFFCLRHMKRRDGFQENLFLLSIVDMLTLTKEYKVVLGELSPDNKRMSGLIDQFGLEEDYIKNLIFRVAYDLSKSQSCFESVRLFELIQEHGRILNLLNPPLCKVISTEDPALLPLREEVTAYCKAYSARYPNKEDINSDVEVRDLFLRLMDILTFFDLYFMKKYDEAKTVMRTLGCLPFSEEEVADKFTCYKNSSNFLKSLYPDALLFMMTIIHSEYSMIMRDLQTGNTFRSTDVDKKLLSLKAEAKALTLFAASPSFYISTNKNEKFVQLYISIH